MTIFTNLGSGQAIPVNIGQWQTKIFYIAIYSTGECSEVQHFQVVDPETNSVDALIFQRVTKCYNLLCSINRIKNELLK